MLPSFFKKVRTIERILLKDYLMYCQTEEGWRIQQLKHDDQEKQYDNFN